MIEIPVDHPDLPGLFNPDVPRNPMLFAVLKGHNPGRAVADDAVSPSQCVLRANHGQTFHSQQITQSFLSEAIVRFRQIGPITLVWWPQTSALSETPPAEGEFSARLEFYGSLEKEALAATMGRLPAGYEIRPLDMGLLKRCAWRSPIEKACGSLDNFLVHGLGFCVMRGEDIITEVYAPFWGANSVEIGVVTSEAYRRKGFATVACAFLVDVCQKRGYQTYWSCDANNAASIAVARRLGYKYEGNFQVVIYRATS